MSFGIALLISTVLTGVLIIGTLKTLAWIFD